MWSRSNFCWKINSWLALGSFYHYLVSDFNICFTAFILELEPFPKSGLGDCTQPIIKFVDRWKLFHKTGKHGSGRHQLWPSGSIKTFILKSAYVKLWLKLLDEYDSGGRIGSKDLFYYCYTEVMEWFWWRQWNYVWCTCQAPCRWNIFLKKQHK